MSALPTPREWKAVFDGFEHDGVRVTATAEERGPERPYSGTAANVIARQGREPAAALLTVAHRKRGQLEATHRMLEGELADTGFGRAFIRHMERGMRGLGVQRVNVFPAAGASYLLAQAGYVLDEPDTLADIAAEAVAGLHVQRLGKAMSAGLVKAVGAAERGDITTLRELAEYGSWDAQSLPLRIDKRGSVLVVTNDGPRRKWWPGKLILLAAEWAGHKTL